jgi:pimeloyl-ACP methyl ester carboxylesterase
MITRRLLPLVQRAARLSLNACGFASSLQTTPLGRIHMFDAKGAGRLPTIVVLHGIGSAASQFARLLMALRPHVRRVLAPDLPGHGFSDDPREPLSPELLFCTLRDLLDRSSEEPVALVGNSLGGALALRYALERPARVCNLALISPAGAQMTTLEWQSLLDGFRVESADDARRLLARLYHRMPIYMPVFASSLRDSLQRSAVRDVLRAASPNDLPTPERLRELRVPTLLIWGRSERVLPPSSLAYFRAHLPERTLIEEVEGFGHCPHVDDPRRLARHVVAFMASHTPAGGAAP